MEQKIKNDNYICIGSNIRKLRKQKGIRQVALIRELQLLNISITREALVKIEGGRQHVTASQLCAIRDVLGVTYDDLLKKKSVT